MRRLALFIVPLLILPVALHAHHSTSLNFSDEINSIEGQIKSVRWVNPHCSFVLEVMNEAGVAEEWLVELLARIALEVGATVTVTGRVGYRPNSLYFEKAELQDGRQLLDLGPIR